MSTATITIRAAGVSPANVCVLPAGSVTFTNSDTAPHDIQSGTTCTQLNMGVIPATESRIATLPTAAVCPYHDELNPSNAAFQGIVAVTSAPTQGPGY
jgi:plastocyanin